MKNQKGSAIIMVLVILTVLVITSTYLMQNKTQRAGFTRHMSNEKKLEVLMEAVLDMAIANIKKHANDHDPAPPSDALNKTVLRCIATTSTSKHSSGDKNAIMNVPNTEVDVPNSFYNTAITSMTGGAGVTGTFNIKSVKAKLSHAEAFGEKDNYEVVGVTERATSVTHDFPNNDASPSGGNWRVPFHYPPHNKGGNFTNIWNEDTQSLNAINDFAYQSPDIAVKLKFKGILSTIAGLAIPDEVKVKLLLKHTGSNIDGNTGGKTAFEFGIHLEKSFVDQVNDLIDLANLIPFVNIDKISDESVTESVAKAMGASAKMDLEELILDKVTNFKEFKLQGELSPKALQKIVMGTNDTPYDYNTTTSLIPTAGFKEKGALLQLICEGDYTPPGGKKIERTLVAEVPFKVSDVQPMAPEHTFFVVNSTIIGDCTLPGKVDFNKSDATNATKLAVKNELIFHNMAHEAPNNEPPNKTTTYGKAMSYNDVPPAGRIRVNGSNIEPVLTFLGSFDCPEASQLTSLALSDKKNEYCDLQLKVTFGWTDISKPGTSVVPSNAYIHFPIITTRKYTSEFAQGLDGVAQVFSGDNLTNIFTMPTLFYGYGHMDYPLNSKIEGKVPAKIAQLHILAKATNQLTFNVDVEDKDQMVTPAKSPWHQPLEIYYGSEVIKSYPKGGEIPYGLPNINAYNKLETAFTGNIPANMPVNCYSDNQYRKKASRFYTDTAAFVKDCGISIDSGGLQDGANIRIDGVIYVNGTLDFATVPGNPVPFIGNGLLVADNIRINNKNITLKDKDSSLGLIARSGSLDILNSKVAASCFSNQSPTITGSTIFGNLIVNAFKRDTVYDTNIRYTPHNISVKGTKFPDDGTDKDNDRRYYASFADNWSKSYFQKK